MKRAFYILTRERYIQEIINDYAKGNAITDEKLALTREKLCHKHKIPNRSLNTYKYMFYRNYCWLCDPNFDIEKICDISQNIDDLPTNFQGGATFTTTALNKHYNDIHTQSAGYTDEANVAYKKMVLSTKKQNEDDSEKLLRKYKRYFRKSAKRGQQKMKTCSKFYCEICKIHYTTKIKAMVAHALAHERDDFIKIGKVPNKNIWKPEQHLYNCKTGKLYHGPEARLHRIVVPTTYKIESDEKITCRKCKNYSRSINGITLHAYAKQIEKMRDHEKNCNPKRPKQTINE